MGRFGTKRVSLQRLPGWAQSARGPEWPRESWGYHGDDGHSFASRDQGELYGPKFTSELAHRRASERLDILTHVIASDIVGCGVDFTLNRAFYTKNGAYLGIFPAY